MTHFNTRQRHPPRSQAAPTASLVKFLTEIQGAFEAGHIGRETATAAIKGWPSTMAADLSAKLEALRRLSVPIRPTH
jgi:hypothetical protein